MISTPSCIGIELTDTLTVAQALTQIKATLQPLVGFEKVALRSSLGRILAEDMVSPLDVPAYPNAAMDGYALQGNDLPREGFRTLSVIGTALAGQPFTGVVASGQCVRMMTGAIMPTGTDTVVMQEHVEQNGESIRMGSQEKMGQHVRGIGEDLAKGQQVLAQGKLLGPPELGLLASLGIAEVLVKPRLRVAYLSTGDELCRVGQLPQLGQIYDSNRYTLYGMLTRLGVEVMDLGNVPDEPLTLQRTLAAAARNVDVLITSGGVSVGEADFIKDTLSALGQIHFWKIAMRPGRPLAYGKIDPAVFFGLPGNPVAVMVTFYQLVQPALLYLMGQTSYELARVWRVRCLSTLKKRVGCREFQRGILSLTAEGEWIVRSTGPQGSGILRSMSEGNCFIILAEGLDRVEAGDWVEVQPFAEFM